MGGVVEGFAGRLPGPLPRVPVVLPHAGVWLGRGGLDACASCVGVPGVCVNVELVLGERGK